MVKIFVGNIPDGVSDDEMRALFAKHGKVTECDVLGTYGFVHMETDDQAELAIKTLDKYSLNGQQINVEKSKGGGGGRGGGMGSRGSMRGGRGGGMFTQSYLGRPPPSFGDNSATAKSARRSGCVKLHIANLPDNCRSSELRQLFDRYGHVAECDVVEDRKIAFVHIEESAGEAAINGLNGHNFKGVPLKVQRSKNQNFQPYSDRPFTGMARGSPRGGGYIPTIGAGRGRGTMFPGPGRNGSTVPPPTRGFVTDYRPDRPPPTDRFGSNGETGYGEHNLPPPAKDRMELLDLLDRRRRLEALDPYERRLIACPDPFNLPPPPPEYLRLLRERALVKARLPLPPTSSTLSRTLPTAGSSTASSALTRAIIARRAAASSLKVKLEANAYHPYVSMSAAPTAVPKPLAPLSYETAYPTMEY